jgi:BTB/POZ domain-containing protein KCTD9
MAGRVDGKLRIARRSSVRKSIEETWAHLESQGEDMPRHADGAPLVPTGMPAHDDAAPLGIAFFRTRVTAGDYSGLSLPRTYIGRSLLEQTSFANTDLSESRMCWNDFAACDFTDADLSGCDMRASRFDRCTFTRAVLRAADLRRSRFRRCSFDDAELAGALTDDRHIGPLAALLTAAQLASMIRDRAGPEPPGG